MISVKRQPLSYILSLPLSISTANAALNFDSRPCVESPGRSGADVCSRSSDQALTPNLSRWWTVAFFRTVLLGFIPCSTPRPATAEEPARSPAAFLQPLAWTRNYLLDVQSSPSAGDVQLSQNLTVRVYGGVDPSRHRGMGTYACRRSLSKPCRLPQKHAISIAQFPRCCRIWIWILLSPPIPPTRAIEGN